MNDYGSSCISIYPLRFCVLCDFASLLGVNERVPCCSRISMSSGFGLKCAVYSSSARFTSSSPFSFLLCSHDVVTMPGHSMPVSDMRLATDICPDCSVSSGHGLVLEDTWLQFASALSISSEKWLAGALKFQVESNFETMLFVDGPTTLSLHSYPHRHPPPRPRHQRRQLHHGAS